MGSHRGRTYGIRRQASGYPFELIFWGILTAVGGSKLSWRRHDEWKKTSLVHSGPSASSRQRVLEPGDVVLCVRGGPSAANGCFPASVLYRNPGLGNSLGPSS